MTKARPEATDMIPRGQESTPRLPPKVEIHRPGSVATARAVAGPARRNLKASQSTGRSALTGMSGCMCVHEDLPGAAMGCVSQPAVRLRCIRRQGQGAKTGVEMQPSKARTRLPVPGWN